MNSEFIKYSNYMYYFDFVCVQILHRAYSYYVVLLRLGDWNQLVNVLSENQMRLILKFALISGMIVFSFNTNIFVLAPIPTNMLLHNTHYQKSGPNLEKKNRNSSWNPESSWKVQNPDCWFDKISVSIGT